jgi:hypothetical protein
MSQPYVPPGVTITEAVAPQVVPLIASTSEVVLVGLTLGHQTRTDQVRLGGGAWEAKKAKIKSTEKGVTGLVEAKKRIDVGATVTGSGIPKGTVVSAVSTETEIQLSIAATETEEVTLIFELTPTPLSFLVSLPGSVLESVISVYSATNPSEGENEGKGFKEFKEGVGAYKVDKETGTVIRIEGGLIKANQLVNVTYTYVPAGYYNPMRLYNFNEVQNRLGNALTKNAEGEYTSPLSVAAQKAFESGAGNVILQPLFALQLGSTEPKYNAGGFITNAEQPTAKQISEAKTWEGTLKALNLVETIDLIVPVVGQGMGIVTEEKEGKKVQKAEVKDGNVNSIIAAFLGYEQYRAIEEQYIYGIFGEDSTTGEALESTLWSHAQNIRSYAGGSLAAQNILINGGNFGISLPEGGEASLGGEYMAAAVAGALASRPVASSLTRKGITGFTKVNDLRTPAQKNEDAGEGLMVIEQIKGQIRCRHAISLDNTHGASRSEVSVVRAKFLMVESVKETLENQIIGQIIADGNSPIIVRSAISGVLSALQSAGDLVDFATPVVQITTLEPTTITASFSYRPAFTLNYIDIVFSLDLSSQTVTTVENTTQGETS